MEVINDNLAEQEMVVLEMVQLKSEQHTDLPENTKKVLDVSCQVTEQKIVTQDNEVVLSGNIVLRLIFINELDKYDSKNVTFPFENKIVVKDLSAVNSVYGMVEIVDSKWSVAENVINVSNILNATIHGLKENNQTLVVDLTGEVEVKKIDHKVLTCDAMLHDRFEIEENIELDKNCEGILGIDANPFLRDIACADGKVSLKGIIAVNLLGVKSVDNTSMPYNNTCDIDFAKTLVASGVTAEDIATGTVMVDAICMHIENTNKGSVLVLKITLLFHGCTYVYKNLSTVVDAISFKQELSFTTADWQRVEVLPQINTMIDLENNLNMPANMPYIARVLAVDGVKVNQLQVTPTDGKAVIEGVLVANVLVENEEHIVSNYFAEVPFQNSIRLDCLDSACQVKAAAVPLLMNVKARRGVELLIDAKLGVTVQCASNKDLVIVSEVKIGKDKVEDDSAIRIFIIGEKENIWDLAKRTNLSCAELIKQNPNLENGCVPGERLVVYRHEAVDL